MLPPGHSGRFVRRTQIFGWLAGMTGDVAYANSREISNFAMIVLWLRRARDMFLTHHGVEI